MEEILYRYGVDIIFNGHVSINIYGGYVLLIPHLCTLHVTHKSD